MKAQGSSPIFGPMTSIGTSAEIRRQLLDYFDRHGRDLPWRRERDPYRIWISEVMLQQTRVETVAPYYERWIDRFPTVDDLAAADLEEVLTYWEGLGYYSRARNLHRAARMIRDQLEGKVPDTVDTLVALPGIGPYTAGAIASIAFDRPVAAVDGNTRRALCRLLDLEEPTPVELRKKASELVPQNRPGDFNQALMELGGRVCTPRRPRCGVCPVSGRCLSRRNGTVDERPAKKARGTVPRYHIGTAVVRSNADRYLVRRRPDGGLLPGLWEFPGHQADGHDSPAIAAVEAANALLTRNLLAVPESVKRPGTKYEHEFSHRRHTYHVFVFSVGDEAACRTDDAGWASRRALLRRPMSTAQRRISTDVTALFETSEER